jgi:hypothetical protein
MKRRGFLETCGVSIAIGLFGKFRLFGLDLPSTQGQEVEKPPPPQSYATGFSLTADGGNKAWTPTVVDMTVPIPDFTAGLIDPGEFVIEVEFDEANVPVLGTANENWTLMTPGGVGWGFEGFVSSFEPGSHVLNGIMMATVTIRIVGGIFAPSLVEPCDWVLR